MKKIKSAIACLCVSSLFLLFFTLPARGQFFAKGADVGWLSQMEAAGKIFYNDAGVQQDCIQILKDKGINSIRFRVWVAPATYWNGLPDVVAQAIRAKNKGMKVMIDLHYSDSWADPGQQTKPAAWNSLVFDSLVTTVNRYTRRVMDTLLSVGVTPDWVQVGNETNNGMLWNDGKASVSMSNFARLVSAGYTAVKAASPTTKVIVHLSNGYDNSLFRWMFDGLTANGAQWDVIGMSLYPTQSNWQTLTTQCLTNMNDMVSRYGKEIMIAEVGMDVGPAPTVKRFYSDIISKVRSLPGNKGLGVFTWEPEAYGSWQGYSKVAFDLYGKPTVAMNAFLENNATAPGTNLLLNPSFEADNTGTATPQGWSKSGSTGASYTSAGNGWNADGAYYLNHYQATAYQVRTFQTVTVPNGHYQLTAWAIQGSGQITTQLYATAYGGADVTADIPYNNAWQQITIPDINVTTGQVTIGVYSNANAGNYLNLDSVRLVNVNALPVSLLSYNATLLAGGKVQLNWKTASEVANKQYIVQHSSNGSTFTDIGTVAAQTGSGEKAYELTDAAPVLGANYYRLLQVDVDGKTTELGVRLIKTGSKTAFSIYPNPTASTVVIQSQAFVGKPVTVQLLSLDGKQLFSKQLTPVSEQFSITLPAVPQGSYFIRISGNAISESKKIVIR